MLVHIMVKETVTRKKKRTKETCNSKYSTLFKLIPLLFDSTILVIHRGEFSISPSYKRCNCNVCKYVYLTI
jgi:hypothetical protein